MFALTPASFAHGATLRFRVQEVVDPTCERLGIARRNGAGDTVPDLRRPPPPWPPPATRHRFQDHVRQAFRVGGEHGDIECGVSVSRSVRCPQGQHYLRKQRRTCSASVSRSVPSPKMTKPTAGSRVTIREAREDVVPLFRAEASPEPTISRGGNGNRPAACARGLTWSTDRCGWRCG